MVATVKAVELIVSGEVQGVGYRQFVTRIARKLKLVGFAENLEDGTVRIWCKGEAESIDKFKELINVKNPHRAPLVEVESVSEKPLDPEKFIGTGFKEKFGELTEEMSQWQTTGMNYLNNLGVTLGGKIDNLSAETKSGFAKMGDKIDNLNSETKSGFDKMDKNFDRLDAKYGKVSAAMGSIGDKMDEIKNNTSGISEINKNIEKLAKKA